MDVDRISPSIDLRDALTPFRRDRRASQRPPRVWKFWGTALWGLFIFGGDVCRPDRGHRLSACCGGAGPSTMAAAIHVVGGGLTISLSVIMGLPAVLPRLWLAIRPTRTPFADYLALRWTSWRNFLIGVVALIAAGRGLGFAVARDRGAR